jgi:hypothetical protein
LRSLEGLAAVNAAGERVAEEVEAEGPAVAVKRREDRV